MATASSNPQLPQQDKPVIQWLLNLDPAIRWQVLRELTSAPAEGVQRSASEG